jgi:hypothetical protein
MVIRGKTSGNRSNDSKILLIKPPRAHGGRLKLIKNAQESVLTRGKEDFLSYNRAILRVGTYRYH